MFLVSGEQMRRIVPPEVLEPGLTAVEGMLETNKEGFKLNLFHDPSWPNGPVLIGEGTKTMTEPIREGHPVRVLGQALANAFFGGGQYEFRKANAISAVKESKHESLQADHTDNQAHMMGGSADVTNLEQLSHTAASPLAILMNVSDGPIRLGVSPGSHLVTIEANRFYARHFVPLYREWRKWPGNPDQDEAAFQPYFNAVSDAHLAQCFPHIAADPIQMGPVVLQPLGAAVMLGSTVHAGTSDVGTRLFWNATATAMLRSMLGLGPARFEYPPEPARADPSQTSVVLAGTTLRLLPSPKGIANPDFPKGVIGDAVHGFITSHFKIRARVHAVKGLIMGTLDAAVKADYHLTDRIVAIGFSDNSYAAVFGVVIKKRSGEDKWCIISLEHKAKTDDQNSAVFRSAAMTHALTRLAAVRRDGRGRPPPVNHPEFVGRTRPVSEENTEVIYYSITELRGEPLLQYFEQHFKADCAGRILTEPFRWFLRALFVTLRNLQNTGFRFVTLRLECFAYDPKNDTVQLHQAGFGGLVSDPDKDQFKQKPRPLLGKRLQTKAYVDADQSQIPKSVRAGQLRGWRKLAAQSETETAEDDGEGSGIASQLEGVSADRLHPRDLAAWSEKNRGKTIGQLGRSDMFLDKQDSQPGAVLDPDAVLDGDDLLSKDLQQAALTVLSWIRPFPSDGGQKTRWRQAVTAIVSKPVADAESDMVAFLHHAGRNGFSCLQPAGFRRFANFLVRALADTQNGFVKSAHKADFLQLPVYSAEQEAQQSAGGPGTRLEVRPFPFETDEEWMRLAKISLVDKAGLSFEQLQRLNAEPRVAFLKQEEDKGNGFFCSGEWGAGSFGVWYVGNKEGEGEGRYSVTLHDGTGCHCDAEPCRKLTVKWLLEHGLGGAFLNGFDNKRGCNMILRRDCSFEYITAAGVTQIWIPMMVGRAAIKDAYGIWCYNPAAEAGGNRKA
jgi:hypothetical protein